MPANLLDLGLLVRTGPDASPISMVGGRQGAFPVAWSCPLEEGSHREGRDSGPQTSIIRRAEHQHVRSPSERLEHRTDHISSCSWVPSVRPGEEVTEQGQHRAVVRDVAYEDQRLVQPVFTDTPVARLDDLFVRDQLKGRAANSRLESCLERFTSPRQSVTIYDGRSCKPKALAADVPRQVRV